MYVNELQIWFRSRTGSKLHLMKSGKADIDLAISLCGGINRMVPATSEDVESQSVCSQCISKANHKGIYVRERHGQTQGSPSG